MPRPCSLQPNGFQELAWASARVPAEATLALPSSQQRVPEEAEAAAAAGADLPTPVLPSSPESSAPVALQTAT